MHIASRAFSALLRLSARKTQLLEKTDCFSLLVRRQRRSFAISLAVQIDLQHLSETRADILRGAMPEQHIVDHNVQRRLASRFELID